VHGCSSSVTEAEVKRLAADLMTLTLQVATSYMFKQMTLRHFAKSAVCLDQGASRMGLGAKILEEVWFAEDATDRRGNDAEDMDERVQAVVILCPVLERGGSVCKVCDDGEREVAAEF
jgi:hypothetical protein